MTPEQYAAVARVREGVAHAALCMPPFPSILVRTADATNILAALDAARADERAWWEKQAREEMALEGFGCACTPTGPCATCRAREAARRIFTGMLERRAREVAP